MCHDTPDKETPLDVIERALSMSKNQEPWETWERAGEIIKRLGSYGFVIVHRGY